MPKSKRDSVTRIVVPHLGACADIDARLIGIAAYLGIPAELCDLSQADRNVFKCLEERSGDSGGCLILNPSVIEEWTGGDVPDSLINCITSRFRFVLLHGIALNPFSRLLIRKISDGQVHDVKRVDSSGSLYEIAADSEEICGAFAGISFGPVNADNDYVFSAEPSGSSFRTHIGIGGQAFMASLVRGDSEIILLGSRDVSDINSDVNGKQVSSYFSRFVSQAMALRYIFGELSWHPSEQYASFIVDDPLLWPRYGFLKFRELLELMKGHNFATSIAFIPHNYKRNNRKIVDLFRENSERLSICFHGNDHTAGEFASTDVSMLDTAVGVAESRMQIHARSTGLQCSKVMVFPQERFSTVALSVLKAHDFLAAVNAGTTPADSQGTLTIADMAQPAIVRHGGLSLFKRWYIGEFREEDVAFNSFFGKPVFIVEHHGVFRDPTALLNSVAMINKIIPGITWCDLATAVSNSELRRTARDGTSHVRSYSNSIRVRNCANISKRIVIEWAQHEGLSELDRVIDERGEVLKQEIQHSTLRIATELPPDSTRVVSVVHRKARPLKNGFGIRWGVKVFVRRRLSELRDNYISRSGVAMRLSQMAQRHVLSKLF